MHTQHHRQRIRRSSLLALAVLSLSLCFAQIPIPKQLPSAHPRVLTDPEGKAETLRLIKSESWANDVFETLKQKVDPYADRDPEWLRSRLQMYWNGKHQDVFIRGEVFSHAGGGKAPVPTVRYTGARATTTIYSRPKLEDILPYMDNEGNVFFHNTSKEGRPLEWVEPGKTGRNIESINREIMGIAMNAAFLYWLTDEVKYAKLASAVFNTYMMGMYYRNIPVDLNNGHQQTLVGLSSFEVIHEDILKEIVPTYDFLYTYLNKEMPENMPFYSATFKKWANNIIQNGVPHNNWNMMQAEYILSIGLILENNSTYSDQKGREYYIDYVFNQNSIRQWSMQKLAAYGFDPTTGIWAECPGYSQGVVADYANLIHWSDQHLQYDLLQEMPVVEKAVAALPQYLFPNELIVGFGDTHPDRLRTQSIVRMIQNAQKHGKKEQEIRFTALLKRLDPSYTKEINTPNRNAGIQAFFADKPLQLDPNIPAATLDAVVSPSFWAANTSWLVLRNGMDKRNSLMISLNGSEGNHMHANGISMELYGKGLPLAPDAGIGSGYFALDYAEYYGQFPAHNTVCVDGISSYPIMKSNHPFQLMDCYPTPEWKEGRVETILYTHAQFREPETRADQNRQLAIVNTSDKTGYYLDIFRSSKEMGGDKMHDYFYHNLGQHMELMDTNDKPLPLQPTEELAFAGAHLYGYSYLFDKRMLQTNQDIKARFHIDMPDKDDIQMTLWMKGEPDRQIFQALSPMTEGLSRSPGMPYNIKEQPTLTYVARQMGEARTKPFVAIFEPSSILEPSQIKQVEFIDDRQFGKSGDVGIRVHNQTGRIDLHISSNDPNRNIRLNDTHLTGRYAMVTHNSDHPVYFLSEGKRLTTPNVRIQTHRPATVALEQLNGRWYYSSSAPVDIRIHGKRYRLPASNYAEIPIR